MRIHETKRKQNNKLSQNSKDGGFVSYLVSYNMDFTLN